MKLRRLSLLRYGHLSDLVLEVPAHARLCVVQGANEAGKSTALSAIGDALFGFSHRTAFDFLHTGPNLRVGVTLVAADGAEQSFVRRKGRSNTLRDAHDAVLPESAMQRFLGGASRELFEHMFGLNGDRLRAGGAALVQGGGSVGESLFAAGTGLLGARGALARLDEEAKTLFGSRGRRAVNDAVDRWRESARSAEQRSVAPRAWTETDENRGKARAGLRAVQESVARLHVEMSRLQRVRRVSPLLAGIDVTRARLAELIDTPDLPPDAEAKMREALAARDAAHAEAARESGHAGRLQAERDALARHPALLAVQDAIGGLARQDPIAVQAAADLPGVQLERERLRAQIADAAGEIGLPPDLAGQRIPPAAARRAVQTLINRHAELTGDVKTARRDLAAARQRQAAAEGALNAAPPPPRPALLRATIDAGKLEGRLDSEIATATGRAAAKRLEAGAALAALPLWTGDAAGLAACPVPLDSEIGAAAASLDQTAKAVAAAEDEIVRLTTDLARVEEKLAHLCRGGAVPTEAAVQAARQRRDEVWREIRRNLTDGPAPIAGTLPELYEKLAAEADLLADRRADEAQRVADYLAETERQTTLHARHAAAKAALAAAERLAGQAEEAWRRLWAACGMVPVAPSGMEQWLRARAGTLKLEAEARALQEQRDQLQQRRAAALTALRPLLPPGDNAETLAALLRRADVACSEIEAQLTAHAERVHTLARETAALPDLEDAEAKAGEALETWRATWAQAVAPLGLPPDCPIAAAEAALSAWSRIAEAAPALQTAAQRVERMNAAIDSFAAAVHAICTTLGEPAGEEPAATVAARLIRRLADARQAETSASDLLERIRAHCVTARSAEVATQAAETALAALRRRANADDDLGLELAIQRAQVRDRVVEQATDLAKQLTDQGDGIDEALLREEAEGSDPDKAAARIKAIDFDLAELGTQRETLSAESTRLEAALACMREGQDAASAAQDARHALAEAGAAAERYARLHVARVLLRSGIERFRKAQQDPLLRAAGTHLATLTLGRYVRLGVNPDDSGKPILVAMTEDGTECPVDALSDGARDQLYLALRAAAIEAHAAHAEKLPFIADDLLVHFDDARAAAAIDVLRALGRTTQVILFTHHDHVAELAAARAAADIAVIRFSDLLPAPRAIDHLRVA